MVKQGTPNFYRLPEAIDTPTEYTVTGAVETVDSQPVNHDGDAVFAGLEHLFADQQPTTEIPKVDGPDDVSVLTRFANTETSPKDRRVTWGDVREVLGGIAVVPSGAARMIGDRFWIAAEKGHGVARNVVADRLPKVARAAADAKDRIVERVSGMEIPEVVKSAGHTALSGTVEGVKRAYRKITIADAPTMARADRGRVAKVATLGMAAGLIGSIVFKTVGAVDTSAVEHVHAYASGAIDALAHRMPLGIGEIFSTSGHGNGTTLASAAENHSSASNVVGIPQGAVEQVATDSNVSAPEQWMMSPEKGDGAEKLLQHALESHGVSHEEAVKIAPSLVHDFLNDNNTVDKRGPHRGWLDFKGKYNVDSVKNWLQAHGKWSEQGIVLPEAPEIPADIVDNGDTSNAEHNTTDPTVLINHTNSGNSFTDAVTAAVNDASDWTQHALVAGATGSIAGFVGYATDPNSSIRHQDKEGNDAQEPADNSGEEKDVRSLAAEAEAKVKNMLKDMSEPEEIFGLIYDLELASPEAFSYLALEMERQGLIDMRRYNQYIAKRVRQGLGL